MKPRIQVSGEPGGMERYCRAVQTAGGLPVPGYAPEPDPSCAGLLLCGGGDMAPYLFGQEDLGSNPPDLKRDLAELALFRFFQEAGRPVFGICRGLQVIHVALGGTIIQDLPPDLRRVHAWDGADRCHLISTAEDSLLRRLWGSRFPVNSAHHQAVAGAAPGMRVTAWADGDVPEAEEHRTRPVFGVQFHPERMGSCPGAPDGLVLFSHFLSLCRR